MSHEAFGWALRQDVRPPARFMLALLGDRANQDGECWPSTSNLSRLTGYDVRTVRRLLRELELAGYVHVRERASDTGRSMSSIYRLQLHQGVMYDPARPSPPPSGPGPEGEGGRAPPSPQVCGEVRENLCTTPADAGGGGGQSAPPEGGRLPPLDPSEDPKIPPETKGSICTGGAVDNSAAPDPEALEVSATSADIDRTLAALASRFGRDYADFLARHRGRWEQGLAGANASSLRRGLVRAADPGVTVWPTLQTFLAWCTEPVPEGAERPSSKDPPGAGYDDWRQTCERIRTDSPERPRP